MQEKCSYPSGQACLVCTGGRDSKLSNEQFAHRQKHLDQGETMWSTNHELPHTNIAPFSDGPLGLLSCGQLL